MQVREKRRWCIAAVAVALLGTTATAQTPDPGQQIPATRKTATVRGDFTLGHVGDLIIANPLARVGFADFDTLLNVVKTPDVTISNLETPTFNAATYRGQRTVFTRLQGPATIPADVAAMGIDMVTLANNHAMDWGVDGLREMEQLLDDAGVRHAGTGATLGTARAATFFETAKGRISLVSASSTFGADAPAADQVGEAPARAGISMLRTERIVQVTAEEFATLRGIVARDAIYRSPRISADATQMAAFGQSYRISDKSGSTYEINPFDHFEILKAIRAAKSVSDLTVFSMHAHESPTGRDDDSPFPADFIPRMYHDAVDAGADVVIGGGSHALRGIEVYKGKPIFYGVGQFTSQGHFIVSPEGYQASGLDPHSKVEGDFRSSHYGEEPKEWRDGFVGMVDYTDGVARRIRIYPIDLSADPTRPKGVPKVASPARAREILEQLQAKSQQFHTVIRIRGDIGIIDIPPAD